VTQQFNTTTSMGRLTQAQREASGAFINSQRHEGWVCLPASYATVEIQQVRRTNDNQHLHPVKSTSFNLVYGAL
jgi:hypothetical protein